MSFRPFTALEGFHRAVAETLAALDLPTASAARRHEAVEFALAQIAGLPAHTALGVSAAAITLSATGFRRMDAAGRADAVAAWGRSKLPSTRLYLRLVRSLVLFGAYDTTGALV